MWHIAALTRVRGEDFPDLDKVTGDRPTPKTMSPEQMLTNLRTIAAGAGGATETIESEEV